MPEAAHFTPALFEFLAELGLNNERGWFQSNKGRYEADVREPLLNFVDDFGERLAKISAHYVADPRRAGGSMFRIHRDVRFSRDKAPYKTNAGAHFRHKAGREVHGPGFYLHLEPGNVFVGAGLWHPDSETLAKIRGAIVGGPERWRRIIDDADFRAQFRVEGESLKRAPKGYDADHPLIEDLKRKDFIAATTFSEDDACAPDFIDVFADACKRAGPFTEFLTTAVGLPW
jgi:uncharacterized protein (TIGR02453 family)